MGSEKKDLEIIYNLQWKNNPGHVNDKANIVAMCDIPATTLNWETFKSYLLKNSGAAGDDVKVSYVSINDKEFPIESQLDFQIALYSFRQRARQGGIITLKLDCIKNSTYNSAKRLRRTETKAVMVPDCNFSTESEPPEWFKKYMMEFKKEIMDEVTESVVNAVSALKLNGCNSRKAKFESCRRVRRNSFCDVNDKEMIKSLKLEKKIDSKLDKLEAKTSKLREKKMTLVNCDLTDKQVDLDPDDVDRLVNITIVGKHEVAIQHMWGGEVYQQEWEIINSGEMEWNEHTELRYAWGSEQLKPVNKVVPCPKLKPHEKGTISIYLEMPKKPGEYECYWYFHHDGRRLARWVGCHFTVDQTPMAILTDAKDSLNVDDYVLPMKCMPFYKESDLPERKIDNDVLMNVHDNIENMKTESQADSLIGCPSETQNQGDSLIGCPSETQSIISIAESTSSVNSGPSDEFVVVCLPEIEQNEPQNAPNVRIPIANIKVEKIDDHIVSVKKDLDNNESVGDSVASVSDEQKSKYAYIHYNGQKIPVPKSLLRSDYLENAEDAPPPIHPTYETLHTASEPAPVYENTCLPVHNLPVEGAQKPATIYPTLDNVKLLNESQPILKNLIPPPFAQSVFSHNDGTTREKQFPSANEHGLSHQETKEIPIHYEKSVFWAPCYQPANDSLQFCPTMTSSISESMTQSAMENKPRLFVFPLNRPGFEVVYPPTHPHSLPESLNYNQNELSTNQSIYLPSVGNVNMDNLSFATPRTGAHVSQSSSSIFRQKSPPNYNHSLCGGQYCEQYAKTLRTDAGEYYHQYQADPGSPTAHINMATAPPPPPESSGLHMIPDTIVTGAVNVASSALNTARSVINMFTRPEQGKWLNGRWIATVPNSPREKALKTLHDMGFWDRDLNATLLARYNDDIQQVVVELLQ